MSDHETRDRLPSNKQWETNVRYAVRTLLNNAERYQALTLARAPRDFGPPHLNLLMRPSYLRQLSDAAQAIAEGLYQVEIRSRYHQHRTDDAAQVAAARKQLQQAARTLATLADGHQR